MVQEFHVLKCHHCEIFQVHIVKKAKKWECKVCGTKQSVVKVFGQGSAKDCRIHVQSLNEQRSRNLINSEETSKESDGQYEIETTMNNYEEYRLEDANRNCDSEFQSKKLPSKWQKYMEPDGTDELSDILKNNSDVKKYSLQNSWNSIQDDELSELKPEKLPYSKEYSQVEKNRSNNEADSSSQKIFHFLSHDEFDTVDDILDV